MASTSKVTPERIPDEPSGSSSEEEDDDDDPSHVLEFIREHMVTGDFCTEGVINSIPNIEVKNRFTCKFPCIDEAARALIELCEAAPFGRGTETVIDPNVRSGWQLTRADFSVRSTKWLQLEKNSHQSEILEAIRAVLCNDVEEIRAELYKLFVYEKGSHFKVHLDSQRDTHHFATLLVFLPCVYEGGDLVVRHSGKTKRFNFSMSPDGELNCCHYVAFFTDCEHEIEPVTSGYRVALQYNVYFSGSRRPTPPDLKLVSAVQRKIDKIYAEHKMSIGYICEHQYALRSISPNLLKGDDNLIYQTFRQLQSFTPRIVPVHIVAGGTGVGADTAQECLQEAYNDSIPPDIEVYDMSVQDRPPNAKRVRRTRLRQTRPKEKLLSTTSYGARQTGEVLFINLIEEFIVELNPIAQKVRATGNEGNEFELQYQTVAIILDRNH